MGNGGQRHLFILHFPVYAIPLTATPSYVPSCILEHSHIPVNRMQLLRILGARGVQFAWEVGLIRGVICPHILRRTRPTGCNFLHGLDFSEKTFIHLPDGGYDEDMQKVHDFLVLGEA
jgi:hypothetical protein